MHTLLSKMRQNKDLPFVFLILAVAILIGYLNFPFGKWLLGWDNLVPELNFEVNFKRGLFSLWQENEGFGLTGGHGYAATLPHTLLLYLFSFFIPQNALRIFFHLLMYTVGALGSYFLISYFRSKDDPWIGRASATIGALFYLVNFATIQMMYIPLEAFSAHFGLLPWLILYFFKVINYTNRKNLIIFTLLNLAASMQGFIPPLFIVYMVFIGLGFVIRLFIDKHNIFNTLKMYLFVTLIILATNAYWLLPIGYYTFLNSKTYLNAYNNITQTNEFILKNEKYGGLNDMVNMRGFIYESGDVKIAGEPVKIFEPWIKHFEQIHAKLANITLFALVFLGFLISFRKKSWESFSLAGMLILTFTFLATDIPPFSLISDIFRNHIPVFKQAFRIPFTKFAISWSLFYSVFLAFGTFFILKLTDLTIKAKKTTIVLIVSLISSAVIISGFPVFTGNLFYKRIHVDLPKEYLQLFEYFKKIPETEKIAHLPSPSPTGWSYYNWGYTGSGFLWYGLTQQIIDRNFDVWSNYNENFYWELSYALYSKDQQKFNDVLDKYNISWVIIDQSLSGISHPRAWYNDYAANYLTNGNEFYLEQKLGSLDIYHRSNGSLTNIELYKNLPDINPEYEWNNNDKAYEGIGIYKTTVGQNNSYYPFRSIFTGRGTKDNPTSIAHENDILTFSTELTEIDVVPSTVVITDVDASIDSDEINNLINVNDNYLNVNIPLKEEKYVYSESQFPGKDGECWPKGAGKFDQKKISGNTNSFVRLTAIDATTCRIIILPEVEQGKGYLVAIKSRNVFGLPLNFWIENLTSRHVDQQLYLENHKNFDWDYIVIPSMAKDGIGYTLHFDNVSIGNIETVNDIAEVFVYPIPYELITGMYFSNGDSIQSENISKNITTIGHNDPTRYDISLQNIDKNATVALWQSYHEDWKAYSFSCNSKLITCNVKKFFPFIFGTELKDHVLINNWANGWRLRSSDLGDPKGNELQTTNYELRTNIVIIFWPQVLQYIGLVFLVLILPFLIFPNLIYKSK